MIRREIHIEKHNGESSYNFDERFHTERNWYFNVACWYAIDGPRGFAAAMALASHCILDKGEKSPEKARLHPEPRPPSGAPAGTISLTPQPRLAEGADYCSPPGCSSLAPLLSANFLAGDKGKNKTDSGLPSSRPSPETSFSWNAPSQSSLGHLAFVLSLASKGETQSIEWGTRI